MATINGFEAWIEEAEPTVESKYADKELRMEGWYEVARQMTKDN